MGKGTKRFRHKNTVAKNKSNAFT